MDTFHYIINNWSNLLALTWQHTWLVLVAVGCAIVAGVPLGVLIVRVRWLAAPVLGIATVC